ncbi:hypothetical protein CSQ96_02050 [Janthinobacterium sp. BJB412]|nr:hypothetical protein CSQ96_02050 [Janthinobacterium sp. BJB412]
MLDADHHLKTMRTLEKIADAIWMRRQSINFGALQTRDESTFLQSWVDARTPALWNNKPAWYWIEADLSNAEFATMARPTRLPAKAARFGELANYNLRRLHCDDIHAAPDLNIVYSGQADHVFTRLRTHFALSVDNTATGALGLAHYPLSHRRWRANVFHEAMIGPLSDLSEAERAILRQLAADKHGRELVESCWRMENGWPVLCKK